jgi:hypothetical protein
LRNELGEIDEVFDVVGCCLFDDTFQVFVWKARIAGKIDVSKSIDGPLASFEMNSTLIRVG